MASQETGIPERPKDPEATTSADAAAAEADKGPSKKDLKKLEKEKAKADKAAKRAEEDRKQKEQAEASDTAKHLYGKLPNGLIEARITDEKEPKVSQDTEPANLLNLKESTVATIRAVVHNARGQSAKLAFLDLRQQTENIQAVIAEGGQHAISRQMVKWCAGLNRETIVLVTGEVKAPLEPVNSATISHLELHVEKCFVISEGPLMLPMQIKDAMHPPPVGEAAEAAGDTVDASGAPNASLFTRLNNRVLDLRTPVNLTIFRLNAAVTKLYREFLDSRGFMEIQTPKITGAATEGGATVFEVKYFDTKAYLTQSPQFYKQMAISGGFGKVYEVGGVYRAENSNTPRHLTEFTGLDFEMEIHRDWSEVLDVAEGVLMYIFKGLRERYKTEMDVIKREYPDAGNFKIPEGKAPRLTFSEGIKMLRDAGVEASEDEDISTSQEKKLGQLVLEKYKTDFYFLTGYPTAARPSYTHPDPSNPRFTRSYDAFMRGQEVVSGAQRIHDADLLVESMKAKGQDPTDEGYRHYIDAFRMGCSPHGGAGYGLNRIVMLWLGLANIRQATLMPRDPQRLAP